MSQNEPSVTSAQSGVLPEHIRQNLKKYRQHAERITCLECGYMGLMGIKAESWYAKWWGGALLGGIAATLVSVLFGGGLMVAVVAGGVVGVVASWVGTTIISCPNCEADLQRR